ncbi:diacylglycerol kinase family lipid kinase [Brevibacillus sp. SYP-B805]|uniref:diacylglycerol/lipid kinase family protein n=1 Tax=Brevibacillus sp. SYP-B805 TaxID=1578199 RepID=UPI0013E9DC20|nr:diacylglycerol kinase family protein [Brevibacillus sp. SYP-B805]NGQ96085.1 diacylglycerol kinase family lipid kinase [Brevibacillus sp. SYP-B805]
MIGFIVNPVSGNGRGAKVWQAIEERLKERQVSYLVKMTGERGEAERLAAEIVRQNGITLVVAVGGDGTVHEVVNGLVQANTACMFSHIPTGSGNDFSRAYNLSLDPQQAMETVLAHASTKVIDLLQINHRIAVNAIGAGFDGQVAKTTNEAGYKKFFNRIKLGPFAYILSVIRVLFSYQPSDVTLEVDGTAHRLSNVWLIAIANIPNYGGGMMICPQAVPDDGIAEVCVVSNISRLSLLTTFPKIFTGAHVTHPAVRFYRGKRITVSSVRTLVVHADGEVVAKTPITVEVVPKKQRIVVNE